jgi:hypothetical protein
MILWVAANDALCQFGRDRYSPPRGRWVAQALLLNCLRRQFNNAAGLPRSRLLASISSWKPY